MRPETKKIENTKFLSVRSVACDQPVLTSAYVASNSDEYNTWYLNVGCFLFAFVYPEKRQCDDGLARL
jgi:hypothetical protein